MTFFLVKAVEEVAAGNLSGAVATVTSGASQEVTQLEADAVVIENDLGAAFKDFIAVFAPAEAKAILSALAATVSGGITAGEATIAAGTVSAATAGAQAAANDLSNAVSNVPPAA